MYGDAASSDAGRQGAGPAGGSTHGLGGVIVLNKHTGNEQVLQVGQEIDNHPDRNKCFKHGGRGPSRDYLMVRSQRSNHCI